jgi:hypothetical protein
MPLNSGDAAYWRERANEARAAADRLRDGEAKRCWKSPRATTPWLKRWNDARSATISRSRPRRRLVAPAVDQRLFQRSTCLKGFEPRAACGYSTIDVISALSFASRDFQPTLSDKLSYLKLQDAWKHDLRSKFEKRLADAASHYADEHD